MSKVTKSARKSLIWLAVILVAVYGLLAIGVSTNKTSWTPGLALDLDGGRQIILSPVLEAGSTQKVDESDLQQAVEIIRQRIDASGVAESEITVQGSNIVVGLPGNPSEDTIDLVARAAQLQFRPVLVVADPNPVVAPDEDAGTADNATVEPEAESAEESEGLPSGEPSPEASEVANLVTAPTDDDSEAVTDGAESSDPAAEPSPDVTLPAPDPEVDDPSSFAWLTEDLLAEFEALNCLDPDNLAGRTMGDPDQGHAACAEFGLAKLAMGPVEIQGSDLETASSGPEMSQTGTMTGRYEVRLQFTKEGGEKFNTTTTRLLDLETPRNQFAIILDGVVISYPAVNSRITDGVASITGNFTQEEAEQLANQLKFGALPLSLEVQSNQQISATLGAEQLEKGLIAGLIGLVLVMIWSVLQYRALGIVVISSLTIVGGLTFGTISLLSWGLDYRLSLAGVAGLIIAIGITADSFVVYFERVKDELRDGRSIQAAVDHGWRRARRTILASDAVQLLAAITLYVLAVGGVRGFAFTLGLTTVLDLVVTFLFTHPLLVLLVRTRFFGEGHKWSGLDPTQLGKETMYKGRGRVVTPSAPRPNDGLTLAERKAAQRREQQESASDDATEASVNAGEESR